MNNQIKTRFVWVAALICAIGLFASASVVTYGLIKTRTQANLITVTGSAKKQIKSDYVTWRGSFSRQSANLSDAYAKLQGDLEKVKAYLSHEGITESDYTVSSVNTQVNYAMLPNGFMSSTVESYRLSQDIDLRSNDIDRITKAFERIDKAYSGWCYSSSLCLPCIFIQKSQT